MRTHDGPLVGERAVIGMNVVVVVVLSSAHYFVSDLTVFA
jgi:hypothetical protein